MQVSLCGELFLVAYVHLCKICYNNINLANAKMIIIAFFFCKILHWYWQICALKKFENIHATALLFCTLLLLLEY